MLNFDIPDVDVPDWPQKDIAAQGRYFNLYDIQMGFGSNGLGDLEDRNVLLHFAIPENIRAKIDALQNNGGLIDRDIQSLRFAEPSN